MIVYNQLTKAQSKWLALCEHYFPQYTVDGIINHAQLKEVHEFLVSMREKDKRFKCSWPIWLITNNAVSRGVYKLPLEKVDLETNVDPDKSHPWFEEYIQELKQFSVIA